MVFEKAAFMNTKKTHVAAVLSLVVLAGAVALASRPGAVAPRGPDDANNKGLQVWLNAGTTPEPKQSAVVPPKFVTGVESLPASLRDTEVAGELAEDLNGNLKVTRGVRDVFDYFLTAQGEETVQVLGERIKAYVRLKLKEKAAAQAIELLAKYLNYKAQVMAALSGQAGSSLEDVQARRDAVLQVRRTSFDPSTYQAFFGVDDAIDSYGVERFALLQDKSISPQAKAAKLAAIREKLPIEVREAMGAAEMVQTLNEVTVQLNQSGGTPQQLRSVRENLVGAEAADRLEAMDRENAEWRLRVESYLAQRDRIRSDAGLSESVRTQELERLRSGFSDSERVRISAAELIRDARKPER